jgi:hypothetical protein
MHVAQQHMQFSDIMSILFLKIVNASRNYSIIGGQVVPAVRERPAMPSIF